MGRNSTTGFNTVNGRYCCNCLKIKQRLGEMKSFNTVNGRYCCNKSASKDTFVINVTGFNTVNGKYCCNCGMAD